MLRRDEVMDPQSCLNRAARDEPVFVLRANDPNAPATVRKWAANYAEYKGVMNDREKAKHREALELADRMEAYREAKYAPRAVAPATDDEPQAFNPDTPA